ncbi:MAG: sulfide/dihydroorotate dehydrogenase-like FAD/NAD-binding protein [Bacteroidetes bacterium]|jgi:ferredoxin--NADP+ reductase|nr:sulfide/dihydroorotate dehydrogenase-like FAD/NAD-binding protein [Bacteroidota bacterium]MBT6687873.1 sulfide/dihydroorotate dehydrogenase-like FAD/NAD-binding protein [Bacteroidota bacterium]MBT7142479.1 sulfide/dihydroorotate dehydrogenase-like FAD/NAD-binding protein [Bacteroidota bacterium]MBT7490014.1 sulfide/dihydroorotate dehydrogenase-like FAD/NAD-binding protein [Bacteroidota bacterium]
MFQILRKQSMAEGTIIRFDVSAPKIAKKIKAGQFIILRVNETGERIPLTVADKDEFAGIITLIFQIVGKTTALLGSLNEGNLIKDISGPLGMAADCEKVGTVVMVGGGTGVAILHHVAKAFKEAGNYVIGIIGARDKNMLILEDEMSYICDELIITTDDGSYGRQGFVTQPLEKYLEERFDIKLVYAIGPIIMMKNVANLTKKFNTPTMVSLNPIMIDGTGMCGCCRVTVDKKTKFACVHGPDFDGHKVDFDELAKRNDNYLQAEKTSLLFSIR